MDGMSTRLIRFVGLSGIVAFGLAAFTPLSSLAHRRMRSGGGKVEAADAIVVLGATVYPDGMLGEASLRRMLDGIRLKRRGLAPILVFLGARHGDAVEAVVRAGLAQELGISRESILTEPRAMTTLEEAARSASMLQPLGVGRVLLVTGEYHMERARRVFERAGFEVLPAPVIESSAAATLPADRLSMTRKLLIALAAQCYYGAMGRI